MEYLLNFGISVAGAFAGLYLFAMAGAQGDIGELLGKAAANVQRRMPKSAFSFSSFPVRTVEGSPALKFSWADFLVVFKSTVFVGIVAMVGHLTKEVLPSMDQTVAVVAAGFVLKFIMRWLPNTSK